MRSRIALAVAVGLAFLLSPALLFAQVPMWDFSVSAFGGGAFPFRTDYRIDDTIFSGYSSGTIKDVTLKSSVSFGGKLAVWTTGLRSRTGLDFGAEVDVTQYYPHVARAEQQHFETRTLSFGTFTFQEPSTIAGSADLDATIIALNVLARYPFGVTPELPQGRWYPYLGIGGGAEIARKKVAPAYDFSRMAFADGPPTIQAPTDVTDTAPVLQVLAGAKFFFTRHIALFAEYKFTHASHTFEYPYVSCAGVFGCGPGGSPQPGTHTEHFSTNVNHVVGGLAVHF